MHDAEACHILKKESILCRTTLGQRVPVLEFTIKFILCYNHFISLNKLFHFCNRYKLNLVQICTEYLSTSRYKIMRTRMNKMFPLLELTAVKSIYDAIIT